ncbi:stalk domain-containing protein [Paenibacillus thermotolerans]|uniref:stalk domain-containing protein n=1 Tax=Paenibacillus thermotolerans TaxID=3027807 RepID=UPI00236757D6|nr:MULTISPECIES: stalk domain-containing protein [unclassified Paenibacillus]
MLTKRRLPIFLSVVVGALLLMIFMQQPMLSAANEVHVYFDGERLQFEHAQPVIKDGRALVPFRKLFETLGFQVKWNQSLRQAVGEKEGLTIELTIDSNKAKVNGKIVTLDVPPQIVNNSTMVPLRFVSENSGYAVGFSTKGSVSTITIGDEAPGGSTGNGGNGESKSADKAEPYVVKGRVVDPDGKPVKGAEVFADNQLIYNSNLTVVTDADGYYRIELPLLATTWNMGGYYNLKTGGKELQIELESVTDEPFAGNTGAVRNFVMNPNTSIGELFVYSEITDLFSESDIIMTITPIVNGKEGTPITKRGYNFPGGFGLRELPASGTYKITAQYAPEGAEPKPALVRVRFEKEYKESTLFTFKTFVPGIERAEIEVKRPATTEQPASSGQTGTNGTTPAANSSQKETIGTLTFHWDISDAFDNGYWDYERDVVVTLTPVGSNTSMKKTYEELGISLPVGTYKATAVYAPSGQSPVPILLRVKDTGEYKQSVEFSFTESVGSFSAALEFKMP